MVGITRSKVIFATSFEFDVKEGACSLNIAGPYMIHSIRDFLAEGFDSSNKAYIAPIPPSYEIPAKRFTMAIPGTEKIEEPTGPAYLFRAKFQ